MATTIISFGEWIQKRRNQLGLIRKELAEMVGCSSSTIKKIERDERRPSIQIAVLLAKYLQIPLEDQDEFLRRARGEFVPGFGSPQEIGFGKDDPTDLAPAHNLPAQTISFIGRETEIAQIATNLTNPDCRLLTILAAGGMGKTRLAIHAAKEQLANFTDGVTYVSLAPVPAVDSPDALNPLAVAIADALQLPLHGNDTAENQVSTYLKLKELLLVLDNFEHLLDYSDFVSQLTQQAPELKILVTSRERLSLREEWLLPLLGLPFPSNEREAPSAHTFDAVQLFAQRARQVKPTFNLEGELSFVIEICRIVEGMPLAVELAAAWVQQLSCRAIAVEITGELDFLQSNLRNLPSRHRSIRAVFNQSWQRLPIPEQDVMMKLSLFRGGFEREAAQIVTGATLHQLASLVNRAFLSVDDRGRYAIHELIRQFSETKLSGVPDQQENIRYVYSHYYIELLKKQANRITAPERQPVLMLIEREFNNIYSALLWALDKQSHWLDMDVEGSLYRFIESTGRFLEGELIFRLITTRLKQELEDPTNSDTERKIELEPILSFYLNHLAYMQTRLGRVEKARSNYELSWAVLKSETHDIERAKGWNLTNTSIFYFFQGELFPALRYIEQGSAKLKDRGHQLDYASSLTPYAQILISMGEYQKSKQLLDIADRILKETPYAYFETFNLSNYGRLALIRGELAKAESYQRRCLKMREEINLRTGTIFTWKDLGDVAYLQGNIEEASRCYQTSLSIARAANTPLFASHALWCLGNLAVSQQDYHLANRYFEESQITAPQQIGGPGWAYYGLELWSEAKQHFEISLTTMLKTGNQPLGLDALVGIAHLHAQERNFQKALSLLALVLHHPASSYEIKQKAQKLWDELIVELPPTLIAKAEATGRDRDLFEVAAAVLEADS